MRLGAVDLGSNTVRLLVALADPEAGLRPLHEEQVVVRLGTGLAEGGRLDRAAVGRALDAVRTYRERARALGAERVLVVGTAALRDAANAAEVLDPLCADRFLSVRVASGEEEASLTLLGVRWGLPGLASPLAVLDIGGGSTELIVEAGRGPATWVSLRLGVVALAERFLRADPVDRGEYAACLAHVEARLEREAWPAVRGRPLGDLVGTAGTVTTLAALDLGLGRADPRRVHGHRLSVEAVEALCQRLGALPLVARARLPGLEPGRADLVVPGIAIVLAVLRGLGRAALRVSDTGFREGILLGAVGWRAAVP